MIRKANNRGRTKSSPLITKWSAYTKGIGVKIASYLEARSEQLSPSAKRVWLIGFFAVGISCSLGIIADSDGDVQSSSKNHMIRAPVLIFRLPDASGRGDSMITASQYQRIQRFEQYLRRQKGDVSGRFFYDSLMEARPHLADSLRLIDSLFLSQ